MRSTQHLHRPELVTATSRLVCGDPLTERLLSRASRYLGVETTEPCALEELPAPGGGHTGLLRRFVLSSGNRTRNILIKTYPDGQYSGPESDPYAREVAALRDLQPLFSDTPAYRVPNLVDAWHECRALVLDFIAAEPARVASRRGTRIGDLDRDHLYRRIGGWLAFLHSRTYAGSGRFDAERLQRLSGRLSRAAAKLDLGPRLAGEVQACVRRLEGLSAAARLPLARIHGDFSLDNLMVGVDGEIWGLDLSGSRRDVAYLDLARYRVILRTGWRAVLSPAKRRIDRQLRAGYLAQASFPIEQFDLGAAICEAYAYLHALAQWLERVGRSRRAFWRVWPRALTAGWVRVIYLRPSQSALSRAEDVRSAQNPEAGS